MVVNGRPLKRARRNRVSADLYDFLTFPSAAESLAAEPSSFMRSVKEFLSQHARVTSPPSLFPCLLMWQIVFRIGDAVEGPEQSPVVVVLNIVEEDVTRSSRSVYCNQCRVVGWSGNPVCRKRYHFIIRANNGAVEGCQKSCSRCGNLLLLSESRCKQCDFVITSDDLEEWVHSQLDDNTHLLHGVVHANGFGHLLTLNGREGGSNVLTGQGIMSFWDRLCTALCVRKVSVMDLSRKYGMEYRLLHAITNGYSWFGNWGYEFGYGSYALTVDAYREAIETMSNIPLTPLLFQGRRSRTRLQSLIALYCSLADSKLLTLKDLFSFLLRLVNNEKDTLLPKQSAQKLESSISNVLCAWTNNDVEHVQQGMIKILIAASVKNNWVGRHALKGVMSKTASPELLDYCLKHFGGKLTANGMVVQARCNPIYSDVEYRLAPRVNGLVSNYPSKQQIRSDLNFLFDSLLCPETMSYRSEVTRESMTDSATKLLDSKHFVKDYGPDRRMINNPSVIHLLCHVELLDQSTEDPAIPPELIVLPSHAAISDLKNEVAKAFEEVYAMFKRFEAEKLTEYGYVEDSITLKFLFGVTASVRIRCRCPSKHALNQYRKERGAENWTVDCLCGAKDDDGERMLACDSCGVWQHTRCAGIHNPDAGNTKFVCAKCVNLYSEKMSTLEASDSVSTSNKSCNGKTVASDDIADGN